MANLDRKTKDAAFGAFRSTVKAGKSLPEAVTAAEDVYLSLHGGGREQARAVVTYILAFESLRVLEAAA